MRASMFYVDARRGYINGILIIELVLLLVMALGFFGDRSIVRLKAHLEKVMNIKGEELEINKYPQGFAKFIVHQEKKGKVQTEIFNDLYSKVYQYVNALGLNFMCSNIVYLEENEENTDEIVEKAKDSCNYLNVEILSKAILNLTINEVKIQRSNSYFPTARVAIVTAIQHNVKSMIWRLVDATINNEGQYSRVIPLKSSSSSRLVDITPSVIGIGSTTRSKDEDSHGSSKTHGKSPNDGMTLRQRVSCTESGVTSHGSSKTHGKSPNDGMTLRQRVSYNESGVTTRSHGGVKRNMMSDLDGDFIKDSRIRMTDNFENDDTRSEISMDVDDEEIFVAKKEDRRGDSVNYAIDRRGDSGNDAIEIEIDDTMFEKAAAVPVFEVEVDMMYVCNEKRRYQVGGLMVMSKNKHSDMNVRAKVRIVIYLCS